jgi:hypothetical protein
MSKNLMGYFGREFKLAESVQIYCVTDGLPVSSGATISGTTTFASNTPTFLITEASASTTMAVLKELVLTQVGTAGANINLAIAIDPAYLYTSGGKACVPHPSHGSVASAAPTFDVYARKPAINLGAALSSTVRWIYRQEIDVGAGFETKLGDVFEKMGYPTVQAEGTILIYTWAPNTAPQWRFSMVIGDQPADTV